MLNKLYYIIPLGILILLVWFIGKYVFVFKSLSSLAAENCESTYNNGANYTGCENIFEAFDCPSLIFPKLAAPREYSYLNYLHETEDMALCAFRGGISTAPGGRGGYLIRNNGRLLVLDTEEKMKEYFSPIKTEKEAIGLLQALSYGVILDTPEKITGLQNYSEGKFLVEPFTLKETSVKKQGNDYLIMNVYSFFPSPCVSKVEAYDVLITRNAEFTRSNQRFIWENQSRLICDPAW